MRILFVNRIAWPDEGATALYLTDVAEACAAAGHEVHVLSGTAGYRAVNGARPVDVRVHAGVRYHRVPGSRGSTITGRALAAAGFLGRVVLRMARLPRPDVVVGMTDPPFVDVVAGAMGGLRGARTIHWLMDIYPDVAEAAGVMRRRSLAGRALGWTMGGALRRADAIVVLSPSMRRPVLARGVARQRVHVIENWAPSGIGDERGGAPSERPSRVLTLMYSGTYGVAHDLNPLLSVLRSAPGGLPLRLIVQASGSRVPVLRREVEGLPIEVEWREPVPLASLGRSLRDADVHVVSVAAGFERLVTPSKLYAPLALGLPVLLVGAGVGRAGTQGWARVDPSALGAAGSALVPLLAKAGRWVAPRPGWPRTRAQGLDRWMRTILACAPLRAARISRRRGGA